MRYDWLPKLLVPAIIVFVLQLFRRFAPVPPTAKLRYDQRQIPEPLPTGVIGTFMWAMGIALALSLFFSMQWANHLWARTDGPADLRLFAPAVSWCFLPGFAALAIPWPFTVWLLRRLGRTDEADSITNRSNEKGGMDSLRVMKWLTIGVVVPIAFFTVLAIPVHLSIADAEIRVGHYAKLGVEVFPFSQARRLMLVEGNYYRDGRFRPGEYMVIDFADGRRLDTSSLSDHRNAVTGQIARLLLARTDLSIERAHTRDDISTR